MTYGVVINHSTYDKVIFLSEKQNTSTKHLILNCFLTNIFLKFLLVSLALRVLFMKIKYHPYAPTTKLEVD
ncbi:hypothetical protein CR513_53258, partial [Mucuna pruriens]